MRPDFLLPEPDATQREVEAWLRGWLDRHIPSEWVGLLHDQDKDIALKFIDEYRGFVEIFEVGYTALAEAVDLVNFVSKDSWPEHRGAQYLLIAENIKSFRSAQDRLMRGYYQDCGAISRSLYESFVRVLFMSLHPEYWSSAVSYMAISGQRKFNLTGLLRDELRLDWDPIYRLLSGVSHSNIQAVLQQVVALSVPDKEAERYGYRNEFNPQQAIMYMPVLNFVLWAHLRVIWYVIFGPFPNAVPEVSRVVVGVESCLDRIKGSLFMLSRSTRHNSSTLWPRVAQDLDRLIEMMRMADQGQDWRTLVS